MRTLFSERLPNSMIMKNMVWAVVLYNRSNRMEDDFYAGSKIFPGSICKN